MSDRLIIGEYAMPDPRVVCRVEYTAIHQALEKRLEGLSGDSAVGEAGDVLRDFKDWAESILAKLESLKA